MLIKLIKLKPKKIRGFTLIEILVSIIILTFFFGLSFNFFFNTLEDSKLNFFSEKVIMLIELAKKKSMHGDQENNYCANLGSKIHAFGVSHNSNNINLCLYCQNDYNLCHLLRSENIKKEFEIITNGSDNVFFYPVEGRSKSEINWIIKNKNNNRCLDLLINEIGIINKNEIHNCD